MVIPMIDCRDLLEGSPNTRSITKYFLLCFVVFWLGTAGQRRWREAWEGRGRVPSDLRRQKTQAEKRGRATYAQAVDHWNSRARRCCPLRLPCTFPAVPCHTLAPLLGLCHTFSPAALPCQSRFRKVPAAIAAATCSGLESSTMLDHARPGKEGDIGMHCNSPPLPATRGCNLSLCILA